MSGAPIGLAAGAGRLADVTAPVRKLVRETPGATRGDPLIQTRSGNGEGFGTKTGSCGVEMTDINQDHRPSNLINAFRVAGRESI